MTYNIPEPHKPLLQQRHHLVDGVTWLFIFPKCNTAIVAKRRMGVKVGNEAVMGCFPSLGETRV